MSNTPKKFSLLPTVPLTSANILVGNSSGIAASVSMSGDIAISNTGATSYTGTVPVNKGGTNTTSFTAGSIVFAGASGTSLTQDNSNLFWDDTTNNMAIGGSIQGTNPPKLTVYSNSANAAALSIVGRASSDFSAIYFRNNANTSDQSNISSNSSILGLGYGGVQTLTVDTNGLWKYYANDGTTEKMRVNGAASAGQPVLLVNTTASINAGKISMEFTTASAAGIGMNDTGSGNGGVFIAFLSGASPGTSRGTITNNNNTGVLYNVTSDYRLKENVQNMQNGLSRIMQLNPVSFNWKENQFADEGFLAHEVKNIFPNVVTGEKDADRMQQMDRSALVPYLVKAIQELKQEIEALKQGGQ